MTSEPPPAVLDGLPQHLAERCEVLAPRPLGDGDYILYWMHHAVRGHENPALDTAVELGNGAGLPVVVYQGLAGNHRFNNDRHHTFILEGARDAHREIAERGIRVAFHLAADPGQPSPLTGLAGRAAALVVEDYPAPPFPRWTQRMATQCSGLVVAVDSSCIIPIRSQPRRFARAFEFRRHNAAEYAARVTVHWSDARASQPTFSGELGFDALALEHADIAELCARCAIDHGVPPVAHTRGGADAGYARWRQFREHGLAHYAQRRNDAARWPDGVSRLSPYLHHGHVSPLRIAREAAALGGEGATKFLDELLIWRELAFNFCRYTDDPESVECLPQWARETLDAHAADRRPELLDDETLAGSRSGDPLWDLMQDSLRIHGELHNNLRMTWAKAIPAWRTNPQRALDTLVALNHRYALDGSDPNSYGGLLWTLGLFDRPFPERPITGRLRERSTAAHARRIDADRYRAQVRRRVAGKALRVAVIGAGIAGLSAARTLHDHGHAVSVFEKSRGPGGRAATRRHGDVGFDHGAQYFTARDPGFRETVAAWCEAGVVAPWRPRLARLENGDIVASPDQRERFVGVPGMNALGKHLAADLQVRTQVRIAPPRFDEGRWLLEDQESNALGHFDSLVVATPAPQAAELLRPEAPSLAARAAAVAYDPMWALMVEIDDDDPVGFDGVFVRDAAFSWIARNHAKPGRSGRTWVAHASADWTRSHLDATPEEALERLSEALAALMKLSRSKIIGLGAHRWLYALVPAPLEVGALHEPARRLVVCGDWCQGARIEGAYQSGIAAAGRLLGRLVKDCRDAEVNDRA